VSEYQELIPIEQHTLTFYGKPIIVVRLPDGRPGVVLRFLCENLHIDTNAVILPMVLQKNFRNSSNLPLSYFPVRACLEVQSSGVPLESN